MPAMLQRAKGVQKRSQPQEVTVDMCTMEINLSGDTAGSSEC